MVTSKRLRTEPRTEQAVNRGHVEGDETCEIAEARGWWCERCGSTRRVEIDHDTGWTLTHDTVFGDLRLACEACHDLKTINQLRWTGPPGEGQFVDQDGNPWRAPPDRKGSDPSPDEERARPGGRDDPPLFTLAD